MTARLPLQSFLLGLSLITLLAPAVSAQDYPNRPIRFIVGFPPGGSVDVLARAVANQATKTLGQPILVENRARASTNAASDFVAKERPDGYTVLVASDSIAINASLFKNLSFNPVTSFAPVTQAITSPQVLAVRPNFGVKNRCRAPRQAESEPRRGQRRADRPGHHRPFDERTHQSQPGRPEGELRAIYRRRARGARSGRWSYRCALRHAARGGGLSSGRQCHSGRGFVAETIQGIPRRADVRRNRGARAVDR